MATNSTALACTLDDFSQLETLPFYKQANGFEEEIVKGIPHHIIPTYVYLRAQAFKNHKRKGRVTQSNSTIGKATQRSARTIQRHNMVLQELGYLRIVETYRGKYRVNHIIVTCPQAVLERLLNTHKPINCIKKYATPMSWYHDTGVIHNNRYIDKSDIKSNIRETSPLDDLEPISEPAELPDIVSNVPCETFLEPEPQGDVARFINKAERTEVVKKVKAMRKAGEIHPKVQANYQEIMVLVQHIIVHCMHGWKYKNFKHALRTAAKLIRNGTWTTPKRVLAAETAERERLANEAKERERRQCMDSGVFRTLGEAMRLTHQPSEADIAKLKADVLERGVNSLGQNASSENIARLKEIIQKTVEDKRKECEK